MAKAIFYVKQMFVKSIFNNRKCRAEEIYPKKFLRILKQGDTIAGM
jgi:hypothetical protein